MAKTFTFSYQHEGRTFSLHLPAEDWDEAERHLTSLRRTATVDGELVPLRLLQIKLSNFLLTVAIILFVLGAGFLSQEFLWPAGLSFVIAIWCYASSARYEHKED